MIFLSLPFLAAAPSAHAGLWRFSVAGTMSASTVPASMPPSYTLPSPTTLNLSLSSYSIGGTSIQVPAGQTVTATADFSLPLTVTATWVPNPNLPSDPAPAVLRVSETDSTTWSAGSMDTSSSSTTGSTASDGLGDACVNGTSSGTHIRQVTVVTGVNPSWTVTLSAHAPVTSTAPAGGGGNCGATATLNSYSVSQMFNTGALQVDQDEQIFVPAATQHFTATVSNASGFTIDWIKISVDGTTPLTATIPNGSSQGYIDWPSSTAPNPGEHTITATAQIHDSIGTIPLDSTRPEGNGRAADDIIAAMRLQSMTCNFSTGTLLTLRTQADTTDGQGHPVSGLVPTPQFLWNPAINGAAPTQLENAGYVMGSLPRFALRPTQPDGTALTGNTTASGITATTGITFKAVATPNTGDKAITLKDTNGTPIVFTGYNSQTGYHNISITADNPLLGKVAAYPTVFSSLELWVAFTHVPESPVWMQVEGCDSFSNTLYGVLAAPTAPMAQPWTGVLDKACDWAKGDTDATTATKDLTKNFYLNANYVPRDNWYTTDYTDTKTNAFTYQDFFLLNFLNRTKTGSTGSLTGQCEDFSDFLVCLSTALGARPLMAQQSATIASINANTATFNTQPLTLAPQTPPVTPAATYFYFHQWTNDTTIFDAAIRFGGTTIPEDMAGPAAGTTYYNSLVNPPASGWNPQTPFVPVIRNQTDTN